MKERQGFVVKILNPIEQLNSVVEGVANNISNFTYSNSAFTRNRKLNAETTIKTTLNMQGNSLNAELLEAFPDLGDRMTASAYEQAKGKLKPEVFEHIFHEYNKTMKPTRLLCDKYRFFAIDGSDFSVPYNPNSKYAIENGAGRKRKDGEEVKSYSQVHANMLFDLTHRTYQDCILQPRSKMDERDAAIEMLERLSLDDCPFIVTMDRGYEGFNLIEHCNRINNCFYAIRVKTGTGGIREIAALPDSECDVDITCRVTTSNHYYTTHKDENLHLIKHIKRQYKAERSKNTTDRRWDFGVFENVSFRAVKFRINEPGSGKEEW